MAILDESAHYHQKSNSFLQTSLPRFLLISEAKLKSNDHPSYKNEVVFLLLLSSLSSFRH